MSDGFRVHGLSVGAPRGVVVEQGPQFEGLAMMPAPPTLLVIHESVTRSAESSFKVLRRRKLSVQTVTSEAGRLVQHADLVSLCQHAGHGRNPIAVGNEVTNPYYPRLAPKKNSPWTEVIAAPWAHEKLYLLPTPAQAEACAMWIEWATSPGSPLGIPREWPGFDPKTCRMAMGRVDGALKRGIVAHTYFGHADGAWLVLYAWMRLEHGLSPSAAYANAKRLATDVRSVDLREFPRLA